MRLVVNGEPHEVPDGSTIRALLESLALAGGSGESGPLLGVVAVEVNRTIVPRGEHAAHALAAGDVIEIVHLVGGG